MPFLFKYETHKRIGEVDYEVVEAGVDLFGKPMFLACVLEKVMRPSTERRTLGIFKSRAEAKARLDVEIDAL